MAEKTITVSADYLRAIERQVEELQLLIEVSSLISSTLELGALMPLVMEKAKGVMEAEACSILLYNRKTDKLEFEVAMGGAAADTDILKQTITLEKGQGIAGWVAENRQTLVIADVTQDDRFYGEADRHTGFTTRNMIAVPLIGRSGLIGVVQIINYQREAFDPEVFELLCGEFAIAIENARFYQSALERERLKQQLEIAATIQRSFLPESPVLKKGRATVTAVNISAYQVGGDVYDFVEPREGALGFLIGDVSGKGISAALYMAKFLSDFRNECRASAGPDQTFSRLNTLAARAPLGMFLTATYGVLDLASGELHLVVAGHPPFILLSKNGEVRVSALPAGPPLGIIATDYPVTTLALQEGDRLIFLTDGVFEARNRRGEMLGFAAVVAMVRAHHHLDEIVPALVAMVEAFAEGAEQSDDLTLVELRWGVEPA